jgi:aminopeptidase N
MSALRALTGAEARERASLVSNIEYSVALDLNADPAIEAFTAVVDVRFDCVHAGSTFLDLIAESVERVRVNGQRVDATMAWSEGRLRLEGLVAGANRVEVTAQHRYGREAAGLVRISDPEDGAAYIHTESVPYDARRWFACFDQPDLKGTYRLTVTAPAEWEVVANAPETERTPAGEPGRDRWEFAPSPPLATYFVAVCAGPFAVMRSAHNGIPLSVYARRTLVDDLARNAEEMFELVARGIDFYAVRFGRDMPFAKYDQLFVPGFMWSAMENPGAITFNEQLLFRGEPSLAEAADRADSVLHELAHMWFGDMVTMRWWDDLWLNEAFATAMQITAADACSRYPNARVRFATAIKAKALQQDQMPTTHPIVADVASTADVYANYDAITYYKGASALMQLVRSLGEDAFFAGLRAYFDAHEWGNASLGEFLNAMSKAAPGRDLESWAAQWLQTTGPSMLTVSVLSGDREVALDVRQETADGSQGLARHHRFGVSGFDGSGGALAEVAAVDVDMDGEAAYVAYFAERRPRLVLPNADDATYGKVRLDEESLAAVEESVSAIGDPVARAVCWIALWDMTRDGEIGASRYLELVLRHAPTEPDPQLAADILAHAGEAASRLVAPERRDALRGRLASVALEQALGPSRTWDARRAWFDHFVEQATTRDDLGTLDEAHIERLLGLLEGSVEMAGMPVDRALRWRLTIALAGAGVLDQVAIAAETDADPQGWRSGLEARAAIPDGAAKEWAWEFMTATDPAPPLEDLRAVVRGFGRPGPPGVSAPYLARYPELVGALVTSSDEAAVQSLVAGLLPPGLARAAVEAARAALKRAGKAPLRRYVLETCDEAERSQRAQDGDRGAIELRGKAATRAKRTRVPAGRK